MYEFLHQLKQERSNTVYTARQVAAQLLKVDPSHFASRARRAGVPELEVLLQNPKTPGEKYPILAPMLFPDNNCQRLVEVFQADVLVNVSPGIPFAYSIANFISVS
jgi:hypothetical protein